MNASPNGWERFFSQVGGTVLDTGFGILKEQIGIGDPGHPPAQHRIPALAAGVDRLPGIVQVLHYDHEAMTMGVRLSDQSWRVIAVDTGKTIVVMATTGIEFPAGQTPDDFAEFLLTRNTGIAFGGWVRVRKNRGFHYYPQASFAAESLTAPLLHKTAFALAVEAAEVAAMLTP